MLFRSVKRAAVMGGPYATVAVVATNAALDTGLVDGTRYYYVVTAFNAVGESAASNPTSILTPIPPTPGETPTGDYKT